jgi:H+-translocating NAD(P) transhydrogenase subunit beta
MGIWYGMAGMIALMAAYWIDTTYTYGNGPWLVAVSMAPGAIVGIASAYAVAMTGLPEMVGAYNGLGGLAAALTGIGQYLDPDAVHLIRHGKWVAEQSDSMLWVQAVALILSIVIGMMTFTGSMVAVLKLNGTIASKSVIPPCRWAINMVMLAGMVVFGALAFSGDQHWNDRGAGLGYICAVTFLSGLYGYVAVMVRDLLIYCDCCVCMCMLL